MQLSKVPGEIVYFQYNSQVYIFYTLGDNQKNLSKSFRRYFLTIYRNKKEILL